MIHLDSRKVAIALLNTTLGMDNLPMEVHGRIATALVLLDQQDGEDFFAALQDAYAYIGIDMETLENLLDEMEETNHD